jgi:hypothetical protein
MQTYPGMPSFPASSCPTQPSLRIGDTTTVPLEVFLAALRLGGIRHVRLAAAEAAELGTMVFALASPTPWSMTGTPS